MSRVHLHGRSHVEAPESRAHLTRERLADRRRSINPESKSIPGTDQSRTVAARAAKQNYDGSQQSLSRSGKLRRHHGAAGGAARNLAAEIEPDQMTSRDDSLLEPTELSASSGCSPGRNSAYPSVRSRRFLPARAQRQSGQNKLAPRQANAVICRGASTRQSAGQSPRARTGDHLPRRRR